MTTNEEMTVDEAERDYAATQLALADARTSLPEILDRQRLARNMLATSISIWQGLHGEIKSGDTATNTREYIAQCNAEKLARAQGLAPVQTIKHGVSRVDIAAAYGRSTDAARGDYRRGSYPASMRGRRVKLPSEQ